MKEIGFWAITGSVITCQLLAPTHYLDEWLPIVHWAVIKQQSTGMKMQ